MLTQPYHKEVGQAVSLLPQALEPLQSAVWLRELEKLYVDAQETTQQSVYGLAIQCGRVEELVRAVRPLLHQWLHLPR